MLPWQEIARDRAPGGGVLSLHRRGDEHVIRIDGEVLMSSTGHASEERLAEIACAPLATRPAPRVLIGGLGMGFTLRAALASLPADAAVVVAEIAPCVIAWCRTELAHLAGDAMVDPRVTVEATDVSALLRSTTIRFDAILLDVDNGPQGLTRTANHALYGDTGLSTARRALRPGGCLAVWSAARHPDFERRLARAGFACEVHQARGRGPGLGTRHIVYVARLSGSSGRAELASARPRDRRTTR